MKAFKSTLEDLEEKRSIHSLQYLNRQRIPLNESNPINPISFIDDELKGNHNQSDFNPYETRKLSLFSSLRNHLNNTSLASQLSAHELIGPNDQQSKQQLIKEQTKQSKDQTGFSILFKPLRTNQTRSRQLNRRALTAPTTTISRLPTIRSNSVSNDILENLVSSADKTNKSTNSPPSSSTESPLNNAKKSTDPATANNPLVQGYYLMHETSI